MNNVKYTSRKNDRSTDVGVKKKEYYLESLNMKILYNKLYIINFKFTEIKEKLEGGGVDLKLLYDKIYKKDRNKTLNVISLK